jgi:guanylate kinase
MTTERGFGAGEPFIHPGNTLALERIFDLVDEASAGVPGFLVLVGPEGAGRETLLREAVSDAERCGLRATAAFPDDLAGDRESVRQGLVDYGLLAVHRIDLLDRERLDTVVELATASGLSVVASAESRTETPSGFAEVQPPDGHHALLFLQSRFPELDPELLEGYASMHHDSFEDLSRADELLEDADVRKRYATAARRAREEAVSPTLHGLLRGRVELRGKLRERESTIERLSRSLAEQRRELRGLRRSCERIREESASVEELRRMRERARRLSVELEASREAERESTELAEELGKQADRLAEEKRRLGERVRTLQASLESRPAGDSGLDDKRREKVRQLLRELLELL